jgi:peptidyl-prolyl cis-trans isomerase SurA
MIYKKILFIFTIIFFTFLSKNVHSYENKILLKINDEIITSKDVLDHIDYLMIINPNFNQLNSNQQFDISKNDMIKLKIKKIEISKKFRNINKKNIDNKNLDKTIRSVYMKLGLQNFNEFELFLKERDIKIKKIEDKLMLELLWNELIFLTYASKVKIDQDKIKKQIMKNSLKKKRNYLLSEIVFEVKNYNDLDKTYQSIKEMIATDGFKNTALIYSISETAKNGGQLGWISEDSFNKNIKEKIFKINKNEHTEPIVIPGGFLILNIEDIKEEDKENDVEKEFKKIVNSKTNNQLKQFSNIHLQKVKMDISINEL